MTKMTLEQFYENGDLEGNDLYIVWYENHALYVGISRNSLWYRWFYSSIGHIRIMDGEWYAGSTIGHVICDNLPESLQWIIELRKYNIQDDTKIIEKNLIKELRPFFNGTHNDSVDTEEEFKLRCKLDLGHRNVKDRRPTAILSFDISKLDQ